MHITVTKPYLPSKDRFNSYVNDIWNRNWLTNSGPIVNNLESELKEYLAINELLYTVNGTVALQIAMKALGLSGEIITTPFSYIASSSSIVWEGLIPVFADIDPNSLNLNPEKIEQKITPNTSAILATHVFGNPCEVEKISTIAQRHKLKIIYDAAHCFAVKYKGKSIFEYGDVTATSFHATKIFHTVEGGAIISKDRELIKKMNLMRNFGHDGPDVFSELGINGKNSEFHAAMGLAVLEDVDSILLKRKKQYEFYRDKISSLNVQFQEITEHTNYNYSYFPIILNNEQTLLKLMKALADNNIFPRRYFYPSLNKLSYVTYHNCPVSEDISKRIICLPLFHDLSIDEQKMICRLINDHV